MLPGDPPPPTQVLSLGPWKLSLDAGVAHVQSPSRWVQTTLNPVPGGALEGWMTPVSPLHLTSRQAPAKAAGLPAAPWPLPGPGQPPVPALFIKGMTAKIHLKMKKVPANPFCKTLID